MKMRSIFISLILLATAAFAASAPATSNPKAVTPPLPERVYGNSDANDTVAGIVSVAPAIPRGPAEMLEEYRGKMTLTAQTLSSELGTISTALHNGQITRMQAEYLIQQRAQLAAMQYEVFSALYDALAFEVAKVAASAVHPQAPPQSDSTVVLQIPATLSSANRKRSK
jgi:hypothetical protein